MSFKNNNPISSVPNTKQALRSPSDGPWCWQSKDALRRIHSVTGGRGVYALGVYVALTWFASDEQSQEFEAAIQDIANRAGCSYRSASSALNLLKEAGLVTVQSQHLPGSKIQRPNRYWLLTPPSTSCRTFGTPCSPAGTPTRIAAVPRSVEESEESKEESQEAPLGDVAVSAASDDRPSAMQTDTGLLRCLASLGGVNPDELTTTGWKSVRQAFREITAVMPHLTEEELIRRAQNFETRFPHLSLTPSALARHWATCGSPSRSQRTFVPSYTEIGGQLS